MPDMFIAGIGRGKRLQRMTALALIPLGLYFAASMLRLATSDQMPPAAIGAIRNYWRRSDGPYARR
jgi:hypothetical protein